MSKINKASDEAEKLSSQIHKYADENKRKLNQLRDEKEKLESYKRAAQHKLKEAQAAKKKVEGRVEKWNNARKQIYIGERIKAAFGGVSKKSGESLKKKGFEIKTGASNAVAFVNNSSFEELTLERSIVTTSSDKDNTLRNEETKMVFGEMLVGQNVFAPPPMVSFSKSKNLVITEIDGSDGEIVERYGDKSWEIKLQGIIIDMKNHQYPEAGVVKLREFFNTSEALKVTSKLFADLNIDSIYFTNVDISGVSGFADTIQYTLSARSIKPAEFFFTQKNNPYEQGPLLDNVSGNTDSGRA